MPGASLDFEEVSSALMDQIIGTGPVSRLPWCGIDLPIWDTGGQQAMVHRIRAASLSKFAKSRLARRGLTRRISNAGAGQALTAS
jgi:hypothetical protein